MDRKQALIRQLADGAWHSGEDLATALGISRAAVWKHLKGLDALGLTLQSQAGRGYRLQSPVELLEASAILQALPKADQSGLTLEVLNEIDSTNRYLADRAARADIAAPAICLAEFQSAGRGRRGRQWQSPFGANLYLSLLWRFHAMPADLPALSLAVGVTVAEALHQEGYAGIGLKWPNDLLFEGRKLGGILIEHRGEMGGPCQVIVGVGLNVHMQGGQAAGIDQPWVSLAEVTGTQSTAQPGRNRLAGQLARGLITALKQYEQEGFAAFNARWARFDLARGKRIRLEQGGQWTEAEALGVDRDGALLVRLRGERQRFLSGDISLRLGAIS